MVPGPVWQIPERFDDRSDWCCIGLVPGDPGRLLESLLRRLPFGAPRQEHAWPPELRPGLSCAPQFHQVKSPEAESSKASEVGNGAVTEARSEGRAERL